MQAKTSRRLKFFYTWMSIKVKKFFGLSVELDVKIKEMSLKCSCKQKTNACLTRMASFCTAGYFFLNGARDLEIN